MTTREELDNLKVGITNFSYAAENCDIRQVNHYSELIGDSIRSLNYGKDIEPKEEKQITEYQSLINEYKKAKDKLFKCDCEKKG